MLWLITCITFIATLSLVVAVFYAFSPSEVSVAARFSRLAGSAASIQEERVSRTGRGIASGTAWRALENFSPRHRRRVLLAPSC